jgi:hypothetical protein
MFDGGCPIPSGDYPPMGPPSLLECICFVWISVMLLSTVLPRPWFVAVFKAAFPFMPDKLEREDE